jgi:hypothetical protein
MDGLYAFCLACLTVRPVEQFGSVFQCRHCRTVVPEFEVQGREES